MGAVKRRRRDDSGAAIREHLLRHEAALFCSLLGIDWPPRNWHGCLLEQLERPDLPPVPEFSDEQLRWPGMPTGEFGYSVRVLRDGGEFECNRGDLPSWCPDRHAGGLYDRVKLTVENTLVMVA